MIARLARPLALAALSAALASPVAAAPATPAAKPKPRPRPTASPSPSPSPSPTDDLDALEKLLSDDATPAPGASATPPPLPLPVTAPAPTLGALGLGQGSNLMNPNISLIMDVAAAAFSQPTNLQGGGHDPKANGFTLQQVEMSLNSPVDPFLRFDSNIVFSQLGVEIEEAYATTTALPYGMQARLGQFLTRFGRANTTHPHSWDFVDQPMVLSKFMGGEGNHGLGAEAAWLAPLPWYTEVVGALTEATGGATARSFMGNEIMAPRSPQDLQATLGLRQFYFLHRDWSLACGLSGATGPNPTGRANRSDLLGADLYLKWRPLFGGSFQQVTLTGEAIARRRQVPNGLLADHGGYGALVWRFAQQWGTAVRYDMASGLPGDWLDPDWTGDRGKWTANLTFWPTEFSRFRLQGSMDRPTWRPEPIYAVFLTAETVIGAHGAHKF